ncbi:MAG: ribosome silencing factor [Burkholderiaceae bacterium]
MDIEKLQHLVVDALEDIQAQDIAVFDTTRLSDMFERVIVASGTSNRQTRALAMHVRDKVKAAGETILSLEGEDTGEWLLVDLGPVVVHIMQPAIRAYYNLEELWGATPVNTKKPAKKAAPRKSASAGAASSSAPTKKAAKKATKAPAKTGTATPRKTASKTAPKTAAKKALTKRAAKKTA